jgi:hypothetical protein
LVVWAVAFLLSCGSEASSKRRTKRRKRGASWKTRCRLAFEAVEALESLLEALETLEAPEAVAIGRWYKWFGFYAP